MKPGDFSDLAQDYANFRPGYSGDICRALLGLVDKPAAKVAAADVGAGTGIWTRTLHAAGCRQLRAVEPNDEMRAQGVAQSRDMGIDWQAGSGEETGLASDLLDLLTMASSFHWTDEVTAMAEFHRVLQPGGWFAALWNPRKIEASPLFVEIEETLNKIVPDLDRLSSGRSKFAKGLSDRMTAAEGWGRPAYLEGLHVECMSRERYLGIWRSVNDVQQQAGPVRFQKFLDYLNERLSEIPEIEAVYQTRVWAIQRL
ncbi:class I SAM-dependent methyltransferase [Alphaproteobacteria bacterium]|nr:class I SAM-dependent methyltransferase [Alphaproteobacteria bacterium]